MALRNFPETEDATVLYGALGAPVPMPPTVGLLLSQSCAAHAQSLVLSLPQHTPATGQVTPPADPVEGHLKLTQAARLRASAQLADPAHQDPAWTQQPPTYENGPLLDFYRWTLVG